MHIPGSMKPGSRKTTPLSRPSPAEPEGYQETMSRGGFRFTRQRKEIYDALRGVDSHPTAVDVFMRVKDRVPSISLATVYSCLETLTRVGLVRQVNLERAPSRFCLNKKEHGHFFCTSCNTVLDVPLANHAHPEKTWQLPAGCVVSHHELNLRGLCPACAKTQHKSK